MQIDIDKLDETQLRALNHRIVERLRFLQQMRAQTAMLSIGERVTFIEHGGEEVRGRVVRYNRKTVTVLCDDGMQWRVSPSMLCKMGPEKAIGQRVHATSFLTRSGQRQVDHVRSCPRSAIMDAIYLDRVGIR